MPDRKWPKLLRQYHRPFGYSVQQQRPGSLCDKADVTLSHAILPMPADSAEGEFLIIDVTG